jgi:uncharacterized protein YciI
LLYALVAYDKPNGLKRRMEARPDHLKHLEALGDQLALAGAFLDEQGGMVGSIVLIEAESQEEAEATFRRDPYVTQDVFDSMTIKPFRIAINKTKAG